MNTQGMMFGNEGPVMHGTWYNPNTGDAFTVRDSFFEDNQYVVTTTDGRYLKYDQIQNYVQTDMKLEDLKKRKAENTKKEEVLPSEVANILEGNEPSDPYNEYLLPDEDVLTRGLGFHTPAPKLGNINEPRTVMQQPSQATMNEAIIVKALKNAPKPELVVDVIWDVYPEKQIEMLKDVMDISEDEIIMWYLENLNMDELVDSLKEAIRYRILCKEGEVIQNKIEDLVPTTQDIKFEELKSEAKPKKPKRKKSE